MVGILSTSLCILKRCAHHICGVNNILKTIKLVDQCQTKYNRFKPDSYAVNILLYHHLRKSVREGDVCVLKDNRSVVCQTNEEINSRVKGLLSLKTA